MFALAVALLLSVTPQPADGAAPGDGLQLAPGPPPPVTGDPEPPISVDQFPPPIAIDPVAPPVAVDPFPTGDNGFPTPPFRYSAPLAVAALLAGTVTLRRRLDRHGDRGINPPPSDMRVVFIPGFGSPATGTFDRLIDLMGLAPNQVVEFDWRFAVNTPSHRRAAQSASVDDAVDSLEAFLGGLAASGERIYVIGHSKGGVTIAELVERWDKHPYRAIPNVVGATLLDPPMAAGTIGFLQSAGRPFHFVPNDGGYDPVDCGWLECHDNREHLGEAAGVEVVVIRNPDAAITSIQRRVGGLRIYDLEDDGDGPAITKAWQRGSIVGRITEAHRSPLTHPAVAACVSAEMHALASCEWEAGDAWEGHREPGDFPRFDVPFRATGGGSSVKVL